MPLLNPELNEAHALNADASENLQYWIVWHALQYNSHLLLALEQSLQFTEVETSVWELVKTSL